MLDSQEAEPEMGILMIYWRGALRGKKNKGVRGKWDRAVEEAG